MIFELFYLPEELKKNSQNKLFLYSIQKAVISNFQLEKDWIILFGWQYTIIDR